MTFTPPDLFPAPSVRILRVEADDARHTTDTLHVLHDRLAAHEHYYPSIKRWIADKVFPDIKTGRRIGYLGFRGEEPVLAAVVKKGASTKLCHLSIESGFRGNKLGHLMFSLMAAEVRGKANEIHFTLPESLWEREKGFFRTFGFESAVVASTQYRLFDEELCCSASFARVWQCVLKQIPTLLTSEAVAGFQVNDGVVLSIHETHARAIMQGRKTVELRRRFAERWIGRSASVYAAGGSGCLLGTVKIDDSSRQPRKRSGSSSATRCAAPGLNSRATLMGDGISTRFAWASRTPTSRRSHSHSSHTCWGRRCILPSPTARIRRRTYGAGHCRSPRCYTAARLRRALRSNPPLEDFPRREPPLPPASSSHRHHASVHRPI